MNPQAQEQKRISVLTLGVGIAVLLIKSWAFKLTNSQAILSDALESTINVLTAISLLTVVYIANKPADKDHPYGHGKIEFFSAAFEGGLITFASLVIFWEAAKGLLYGVHPRSLDVGSAILSIATVLNFALGYYLKSYGSKKNSLAIKASGQHILSDVVTSIGVIVGVLLVHATGILWLDPVLAALVAINLAWNGIKLVVESSQGLMDAEDKSLMKTILDLFTKHRKSGIIRIHHTRVMRSGQYHHIDAHVVVPEFWDVTKAHEETDKFEHAVMNDYPVAGEIHFHVDPCRRAYCKICDIKDCSIRRDTFESSIPLTLEELQSPMEAEEFLKRRR